MTTDLIERRDRAFGAGAPLFYREPLHIVRGEGACLFDADGRRYLDMYNNVLCVGHAHPRIIEAMATQQATLNVHSRYPARSHCRVGRTDHGAARGAPGERRVLVHRHRGERGGAAHGAGGHGSARDRLLGRRLPRH